MYQPSLKTKRNGLPIITNNELDVLGERLVSDFSPPATIIPQEIDIDRFVINYLHMQQDFQYLSHCGVYLGLTVFQNTDFIPVFDPDLRIAKFVHEDASTVVIDNSILKDKTEHRYRFTMGHEASHFILHSSFFLNNIGTSEEHYIRCRADYSTNAHANDRWSDAIRAEQQANRLSSAILMPRCAVGILLSRTPNRGQSQWTEKAVNLMSSVFNVSPTAALYRLHNLGFVDN